MPKKPAPRMPKDIALLQGPTEDGEGARLLRIKEGALLAGEIRPAREGQPVHDQELVRLRPMHPKLPLCEVEVLHAPPALPAEPVAEKRQAGGPARVSNVVYRRNWNTIFGGSTPKKKTRRDWSVN